MNHVMSLTLLPAPKRTPKWLYFFHFGYYTLESNSFNFEAPIGIKNMAFFWEKVNRMNFSLQQPGDRRTPYTALDRYYKRITIQKVEMGFS